jgi:hypothetical protein
LVLLTKYVAIEIHTVDNGGINISPLLIFNKFQAARVAYHHFRFLFAAISIAQIRVAAHFTDLMEPLSRIAKAINSLM